ncbi:MAG: M14 family metallopeptidase [Bacteroidetes bacterium]|nr:M14 family metallopeptidase [Bacteroidota bacterium]
MPTCFRRLFLLLPIIMLVPVLGASAQDAAQAGLTSTDSQSVLLPEPFQFATDVPRDPSIPSPADVLHRETGAEYTLYADVTRYLYALSEASDRVMLVEYARSYENRPLHALIVTSPENHTRLEEIRQANARIADPSTPGAEAANLIANNPVVTWLSYNVHGNEPSSTESALEVLYLLASGTDEATMALLNESVVVIDPTLNPDGRDRYVYWYKSMQANQLRVNSLDIEHDEPFPGGRTNHYWFDLNRDWMWLVHPESQGRIDLYQQWTPQVHMDYHEQGFDNNYFTMPGKAPRNLNLPDAYESWADMFGRASGEALADNQVNYFTREAFEFFYPGYGSSYPSMMGGIGMLAEQGGHSRGGRAVETNDDQILTLRQRAWDHFATSIAVVEASVSHREELLTYYRSFFDPSTTESATTAYFIPDDGGNGYVFDVIALLLSHGIQVERMTSDATVEAKDYWSTKSGRHTFKAGTWVVRTDQARHIMVNTLMQRQMEIESYDMYDMSTWSVPLAYNLSGAAWTEAPLRVSTEAVSSLPTRSGAVDNSDARYAYVMDWRQNNAPKALGMLWEAGYNVRSARKTFGVGEKDYSVGTLIVLNGRNRDRMDRISADMEKIATEAGVLIDGYDVSRVDRGIDLASSDARVIEEPSVGLLMDRPFGTETAGQIWYLFDQRVEWGIDRIRGSRLTSMDLDEYDVLIMPSGNASSLIDSTQMDRLSRWVRAGGTLIGSESSAVWLTGARSGMTSIAMVKSPSEGDDKEDEEDTEVIEERFYTRYEDRRDSTNTRRVSGSAFRAVLDNSHPLAAGMPDELYSLKFGTDAFMPSASMETVGYYDKDAGNLLASGFASDEIQEKLAGKTFAAVQSLGQGKVILLLDKTQYRMFWLGPTRMLINAVMLMPGM